jgi:spore coat protein H
MKILKQRQSRLRKGCLQNKIYLFILSAWMLFTGCDKIVDPQEPESFGLAKVEFTMTSEYLGILNSMVFARREVPARVEIDDTERKILVRYSGQASLNRHKKSFTFEIVAGPLYRDHREYVLSAQIADPTMLHSTIGFYAFRQAGLLAPEAEPAAVYLNGEYQGLYYLIEPIDEDFFKRRGQRMGPLYEARLANAHFSFAGGYDVRLGFERKGENEGFFGELERLITILDTSTPETLPARIEPLLDVENYLRYLAVSVLFHNWDGYFNNLHLHFVPGLAKFQVIPWDLDHLIEFHQNRSRIQGANELSEKLLEVRAYRQRYREILLELMDEKLTIDKLDQLMDETASKIAPAFAADRVLSLPGVTVFEHAANSKQFMREWYAKIRGDLGVLD